MCALASTEFLAALQRHTMFCRISIAYTKCTMTLLLRQLAEIHSDQSENKGSKCSYAKDGIHTHTQRARVCMCKQKSHKKFIAKAFATPLFTYKMSTLQSPRLSLPSPVFISSLCDSTHSMSHILLCPFVSFILCIAYALPNSLQSVGIFFSLASFHFYGVWKKKHKSSIKPDLRLQTKKNSSGLFMQLFEDIYNGVDDAYFRPTVAPTYSRHQIMMTMHELKKASSVYSHGA